MPASPVLHTIDGNWVKEPIEEYKGLTKREAFAMAAMQGHMSADTDMMIPAENVAKIAVDQADALLAALEAE